MRILVTGSRYWTDQVLLRNTLAEVTKNTPPAERVILVHGDAWRGADFMAGEYARDRGWKEEPHPAEWNNGRAAGMMRNKEMVDLGADVCVAFFRMDVANKGTTNCSNLAKKAGIPVLRVEG